jgi:hypothetical protein
MSAAVVIAVNAGTLYNADGRASIIVDESMVASIQAIQWTWGEDPTLKTQLSEWCSTFTSPTGVPLENFILNQPSTVKVARAGEAQDFRAGSLAVVAS